MTWAASLMRRKGEKSDQLSMREGTEFQSLHSSSGAGPGTPASTAIAS
jgi:hypothetical protein